MYLGNISVRYARALLAFAKKRGEENSVYEEVSKLLTHLNSVSRLTTVLESPLVNSKVKEELLITASGIHISHSFSRFIRLVLSQERADLFKVICMQYIDMYRREKNILRITLTLARPIDAETQQRIYELINKTTKDTVDLVVAIDPGIISGFVLNTDRYRLDASVVSQLDSIKKQLLG